jgi:hypothetical protein
MIILGIIVHFVEKIINDKEYFIFVDIVEYNWSISLSFLPWMYYL